MEQYLVFAEGQALRGVAMRMLDGIAKLDGFPGRRLSRRCLLDRHGDGFGGLGPDHLGRSRLRSCHGLLASLLRRRTHIDRRCSGRRLKLRGRRWRADQELVPILRSGDPSRRLAVAGPGLAGLRVAVLRCVPAGLDLADVGASPTSSEVSPRCLMQEFAIITRTGPRPVRP